MLWVWATSALGAPAIGGHALVGTQVAVGEPLTALSGIDEPQVRFSVPFEAGVGLSVGPVWARLHGGVGALLGGRLLAATDGGRVIASPIHVDVGGAAGVHLYPVKIGALLGTQLPARITAQGLVAVTPRWPWFVELRAGVNIPTERTVEPVVSLWLGAQR